MEYHSKIFFVFQTIDTSNLNPLMPGSNKNVTYTETNLHVCLSICDLFVTNMH